MANSKMTHSGTLLTSGVYEQRLCLEALTMPSGWAELRVESLLATAREPAAPQVRYRVTLDREGLKRLRDIVDAALAKEPSNA